MGLARFIDLQSRLKAAGVRLDLTGRNGKGRENIKSHVPNSCEPIVRSEPKGHSGTDRSISCCLPGESRMGNEWPVTLPGWYKQLGENVEVVSIVWLKQGNGYIYTTPTE